ncbi:hypothetical protein ACLOJK_025810 [Asimina triloba]
MAASVASPHCTWLVATCTAVAGEKDSSAFPCSEKLSRRARRRKRPSMCHSSVISTSRESKLQGRLASRRSCPSFQPRADYCSSKASSLFGEAGFSLFGTTALPIRRDRRMNRAAAAGNALNIAFVCVCAVWLNLVIAVAGKAMNVAVQPEKEATSKNKPVARKKRIVVTGMGVVTSLGHEKDLFYNNLLEGVSGISEIESFDCTQFPTKFAGEIKSISSDGWMPPKLSKRVDKFMLYMIIAGKKALVDGGITEEVMKELDKSKCGVLIGSVMGGIKILADNIEALPVTPYRKFSPFGVPFVTSNMGSAVLAMELGWMGPNYSISTACATSNFCILNAADHITRGEAEICRFWHCVCLGGFLACRALSRRNDDPTKASRPWDMHRDGFVMGEGAGVLLLEELEHAKLPLNHDKGRCFSNSETGAGVVLCIEKALSQTGVAREDVNYVNAHANSTQSGDLKEYEAIKRCFGQNPNLRVNSTKSMIGQLLGGAGAVEAAATIQAIRTGWVHPNLNLENPDEGVDPSILVGPKKERLDIKVAVSNSLGFGGHNSSILFAPYKSE